MYFIVEILKFINLFSYNELKNSILFKFHFDCFDSLEVVNFRKILFLYLIRRFKQK